MSTCEQCFNRQSFPFPAEPSDADLTKLREVLSLTRLSGVQPHQVVVAAEAGSHMYGLSTPTSDVDYIVVYKEPTEVGDGEERAGGGERVGGGERGCGGHA